MKKYNTDSSTEIRKLLKKALEKYGSLAIIARELGVSDTCVYKWNDGTTKPYLRNLMRLRTLIESDPNAKEQDNFQEMASKQDLIDINNRINNIDNKMIELFRLLGRDKDGL